MRINRKQIIITLSALTLLILGAIFFIIFANLAGGKNYLQETYRAAMEGKSHLEKAKDSASANNWKDAETEADSAEESFTAAIKSFEGFSDNRLAAKIMPSLNRKSIDATANFLKTAEILSRSAAQASKIADGANEIFNFSSFAFKDISNAKRQQAIVYLYQSLPEINGLAANLQLAQLSLEKGQDSLIALPFKSKLAWLDDQLNTINNIMDDAKLLAKITPVLAGYPKESRFLIILQNNDELRPSGGFIGSYATISVKDGLISSMESHDSYHIDMPAVGLLRKDPPAPIKKYMEVENWYLRDANWSPDWPTSAKQIVANYNDEKALVGESRENFDAVIGITPELISEILKITGPITVQDKEYNADNFQSQLQYEVEVGYKEQDVSSWDRKEVINEVMDTLMKKVTQLPKDNWLDLISALQTARTKKYLLAYFPNQDYQDIAKLLQVDGAIKTPSDDYFMLVDANLAAFKTDAVMDKKISYRVREENDGLYATVTMDYSHNGSFDWRTTRYRSYSRIYAPQGSRMINSSGYKDGIDAVNEKDFNKTSFGFFFSIEPGTQNKTLSFEYKLPDYIWQDYLKSGKYNLFIQKQPGNRIKDLEVSFQAKGNKKAQAYSMSPFEKDNGISFSK